MRAKHRVVILGLDGVPPDLVFGRWRQDLPAFSRVMHDGGFGPLQSVDPPITVPAWTCMVTSKDPGQLGCYGFRNRRDHSYGPMALADSGSVQEPTLWRILSRNRMRSIVLGVPQTYPPQPLRGLLAAGFLVPDEGAEFTYPRSFRQTLDSVAGGYIIDVKEFRTDDKDRLLGQIREMTRRRFLAIRHLLREEEWDFLMAVEMGPDRIHHGFWKHFDAAHPRHEPGSSHAEAVRDYYRLLDQELDGLLGLLDPQDTLLIVSDHGARPMAGGVCINEWMRQKGHLSLLSEPVSPARLHPDLVDWDRTRAWSEGGYYARVFLNVRGREPRGAVAAGDQGGFRHDLAQELREMEGPDGRALGNRILIPEETYRACRGVPPDLIVYLGDLDWRSLGSVGTGGLYAMENDTGPDDANHDPLGILLIREPWRDKGAGEIHGAHLLDVAPTVLDRLGLDIPPDMLGRVISG
jgi:predicted AlkP superfamily phosphohydrolase/phosphomutase